MKSHKLLVIFLCVLYILSCKKDVVSWDLPKLPEVNTQDVSSILDSTATATGIVIQDGGTMVTKRGICYSRSTNPKISDDMVEGGNGEGSFICNLKGLVPKTAYFLRAFATNKVGTTYGYEIGFVTKGVPTVTTNSVGFIDATTAQSGGSISSNGGLEITQKGICYATIQAPTIGDNKIISGSGSENFISNLIDLSPITTYFVRAFAINSIGISYGNEVTFTTSALVPTLTTENPSSVTATSAVTGGNIINDGGAPVTERGLCYSTSANPTTLNTSINCGSGIGTYVETINGLLPNTTYYVRAYAKNTAGTAYGNQISIKTLPEPPTVTTTTASSITANEAVSGGNVENDGGSAVISRGICYSTTSNPTTNNNNISNGSGNGSFSAIITGLSPNTLYYVRAYARNSIGISYGNQISFTTLSISAPTVTTAVASSITSSGAISGGNVTKDGGSTIISRGICYSTTTNPNTNNSTISSGSGIGSFSATLTGLSSNTLYYVKAYARNSIGTSYGNQISFTTLSVSIPTVTTTSASSITSTGAVSGGNVTNGGGSTVTSKGICYSTTSDPTTANSTISGGSGLGSFTVSLTGLSPKTRYYVRAYAINNAGPSYGNQVSFTTKALSVGDNYKGGIVFYLDVSGDHGYISASSNQSTGAAWGCYGTLLSNCNGTALGTGQANTTAIVTGCTSSGIAARICNDLTLNGYSDWYLPSSGELDLMYTNLKSNNLGNFTSAQYWSSTQSSSTYAKSKSFSTGTNSTSSGKNSTYYVRAVRTF